MIFKALNHFWKSFKNNHTALHLLYLSQIQTKKTPQKSLETNLGRLMILNRLILDFSAFAFCFNEC